MRKRVAESDARRGGLDWGLKRDAGEHWGLCGHVGFVFYTGAGKLKVDS